MNEAKVFMSLERATLVEAWLGDFDGDIAKWKDSFYQLWRYQMTWSFAYQIGLIERRNGVYVRMIVRPAYRKSLEETMPDLGYGNIKFEDCKVVIADGYSVGEAFGEEETLDVECAELDW